MDDSETIDIAKNESENKLAKLLESLINEPEIVSEVVRRNPDGSVVYENNYASRLQSETTLQMQQMQMQLEQQRMQSAMQMQQMQMQYSYQLQCMQQMMNLAFMKNRADMVKDIKQIVSSNNKPQQLECISQDDQLKSALPPPEKPDIIDNASYTILDDNVNKVKPTLDEMEDSSFIEDD